MCDVWRTLLLLLLTLVIDDEANLAVDLPTQDQDFACKKP